MPSAAPPPPDSGLLRQLKLSALATALAGVTLALPQIAVSSDDPALARVAALLAAAALVVRWLRGYRRGRFGRVSEVVEGVALLTILSVAPDAPVLLLGLVFRCLYDRRATAAARAIGAIGLLVAGAHMHGVAPEAGQVLGLALGAALAQGLRVAVLQAARHELLLNALIQQSTDVTCIVDASLQIRWISGAPQGVLGAAPERLIGRSISGLLAPDQAETAAQIARELADSPGASRTVVLRMPDADGNNRWVEAVVANRLDEPNLNGYLVNLRDRTEHRRLESERIAVERLRERVEAERERTELETRLQRSERLGSIGQLAGGVAHDFNNLLGIILNYAGFVRNGLPEDDPRREDLAEIEAAASRGARLTRQLLVFSQRGRTQPEILDVNGAVTGLERLLLASVGSGVRLRLHCADDLAPVEVDPTNLEQVLVNLVINARDALNHAGTIVVRTEQVVLLAAEARALEVVAGSYVALAVQDDGPGMDDATRERAVEPFFTTKPSGEGTGLGLATVFGVAHAAGGGLRIASAPGKGTCVTVYLPAVAEQRGVAPVEPEPKTQTVTGSRASVLVVEDEPSVRALIQRVLADAGHDIRLAASGPEALEAVEGASTPFDLVLSDVVMPGMTGLELARQLRERDATQRILLMSGYSEELLGEGAALEVVLPKPFTADKLRTAVARAIDAAPVPTGASAR